LQRVERQLTGVAGQRQLSASNRICCCPYGSDAGIQYAIFIWSLIFHSVHGNMHFSTASLGRRVQKAIMVKQVAIFILKAVLLYVMFPLVWVDLTLFGVSIPRYTFGIQPFFMAVAFVVAVAAAISFTIKSKTPILWTLFCVAYSAIFIVFALDSLALIALCLVVGAISFLYRSKITEPFLVLLPIIAGAWLFLQFVYVFFFVTWANFMAMQKGVGDSLFRGALSLEYQAMQFALVIPLLAMYFLGKHSYVKLYPFFKSLRK
jgi:hypothetical protein